MAIQTVSITLETDFESLVRSFRGKLDQKGFYELSSVVQAVRQWKELIDLTIGPVTEAKLHSNPDDPPDVTLVAGSLGRNLSVEHTDFNNPMRGYVNHLHLAEFPSSAIFLPPLAQRTPKTRDDTLRQMFNPRQTWITPGDATSETAIQLESCIEKKLPKLNSDFLVVTDRIAFDSNFDVAVMYVIARIRDRQLRVRRKTNIIFYSELDTIPTRFVAYWVGHEGEEIRYRNSRGLFLNSLEEMLKTSGLDPRWKWYS